MKTLIVIPARMESTRLKRKVMADIDGKPMILRVWEQAKKANVGVVIVACDDEEVCDLIYANSGRAMLTKKTHVSGSDRVFEVVSRFGAVMNYDVIINLQGDMPLINPELIKMVIKPLEDPDCDIATIVHKIKNKSELKNQSVVKVVMSIAPYAEVGRAVYFSRDKAPGGKGDYYHHQGIYAYQRDALEYFVSLKPGYLEQREKLEQLRAIENGMRIDATIVDEETLSVDTQADLNKVRKFIK